MNDEINYYELLGINNDATTEEIKDAYKKMMKKWHPDVSKEANASGMSIKLNEAKTVLLDETKRLEYDNFLKNKKDKAYENIQKHTQSKKENYAQNNNSKTRYTEEKTYTKWEYFHDYMKYYKTSPFLKALITIGVLLETIICGILQILNYIVAFLFGAIYTVLIEISNFLIGLLVLAIILGALNGSITSFHQWLSIIAFFLILVFILAAPQLIITFLAEKTPYYLSKLNIFLFKKCMGYKN